MIDFTLVLLTTFQKSIFNIVIAKFSFLWTRFHARGNFLFSLALYHFYSNLLLLIIFFGKMEETIWNRVSWILTISLMSLNASRKSWTGLLLKNLCSFDERIRPHWVCSCWIGVLMLTLFIGTGRCSFELRFIHQRWVVLRLMIDWLVRLMVISLLW